jgi:sialate O-acetylesterase
MAWTTLVALAWFAAGVMGFADTASAEVKMPAIFGDHMVLQQQSKLPVWGWAAPGEKITVTFKGQQSSTVAAADGTWRVDLKPIDPSAEAATLTVAGQNTLAFTDVLVGDVWIASGQSNMEFGLQTDARGAEAIATAKNSQIRLFFVPWATALQPQTDVGPATPPSPLNGKWQVCSPAVLGADWAWHGFSAVGYYFAREMGRVTGSPVGMIATYKGGTTAQAWTSVSGLEKDEAFRPYVVAQRDAVKKFAPADAAYSKQLADYQAAKQEWLAAKAKGQGSPASAAPKAPTRPNDGGYGVPGNLFNGMVAPLVPFAIKGVVWYQGESNADSVVQARQYVTLFPRMIADWREKWGQGDFPFLFVQLPNFGRAATTPSEGNWPWLRESQLKTLSLPKTGMAVTVDLGDAKNIHPADKLHVGLRLALVARHVAYGQDIISSGPIYDSMTIEGGKIRLKFTHIGGGLTVGTPPPAADGTHPPAPTELTGFGIAAEDRKFVWAKATVDGDTVVVSSDKVPQPIAVRYNWGQNPLGNLYNKEGLPASPFRTDPWPPDAAPR